MKKILVIALTMGFGFQVQAQSVQEKKARTAVDEVMNASAKDLKDCGKAFKVSYDWKSFDALDWKKLGKEKKDYYSGEELNLKELGQGINTLCKDKDYKEALKKYTTIVYKPGNDSEGASVKASVSGSTITFENYIFGSTRYKDDYEAALKAVL